MHLELKVESELNSSGSRVFALAAHDGRDEKVHLADENFLASLANATDIALDFFWTAVAVYSADRCFPREQASDHWRRKISISVPVSNPQLWTSARSKLAEAINFLTGDEWEVSFHQLDELEWPESQLELATTPGGVCLFSGGLDSLVGAIDLLSEYNADFVFVGHHDPAISGPFGDQLDTKAVLEANHSSRARFLHPAVGPKVSGETSLRSRSLLFLACAVAVASAYSEDVPVFMPENGAIALNVPLTPSRRGSCSTRTAHPFFLECLQELLAHVGLQHVIENPLSTKTKGEVLAKCARQDVLVEALPFTNSCAKRSHRENWTDRSANQCGECMPCMFRRAALFHISKDDERYGVDICSADPDSSSQLLADFRAVITFLSKGHDAKDIARQLIANGHITPTSARDAGELVERAMMEVRELLHHKATASVKEAAGIA